MPNSGNSRAKRDFQYQDIGTSQFNANEYLQNEPMIRKLYTDTHYFEQQYRKADKQLKEITIQVEVLKVELSKGKDELEYREKETNLRVLIQSVLVLIGTILLAFGVNIVTSTPVGWSGWVLSVIGCMIQLFALGIPFLARLRERKPHGQNQTATVATSKRSP